MSVIGSNLNINKILPKRTALTSPKDNIIFNYGAGGDVVSVGTILKS